MKKSTFFLALALILALVFPCGATPPEKASVSTPEELAAAIGENRDFSLACDIDMAGFDWTPLPYSGTMNGNGHALLNLTVSKAGTDTAVTYDGNMKEYDTYFGGLFSILRGKVENLRLVNLRGRIETDAPCFAAPVAGLLDGGTVSGCEISGQLELRAHDRMFGMGGIAGYGKGRIENTKTDVTLINVDTDANTKDEQFLGGAYGAGYIDLDKVEIHLDGYISDHGYVHSGGAVGMYALYPRGTTYEGQIQNTSIQGKITFFEDNADRRAYCKELVGETLHWTYSVANNTATFQRDERRTYDRELRPEMCENPTYTQEVTAPKGLEFGYTQYTCTSCGYTYRDNYTIHEHIADRWTQVRPATTQEEGLSTASCTVCGKELRRAEPKLIPETPSTPSAPAGTGTPTVVPFLKTSLWVALGVLAGLCLLLFLVLYAMRLQNIRRHRRRKRRRPRQR